VEGGGQTKKEPALQRRCGVYTTGNRDQVQHNGFCPGASHTITPTNPPRCAVGSRRNRQDIRHLHPEWANETFLSQPQQ
jgi:hypothetical protein